MSGAANLQFHDFVHAHLAELVDLWVESWSEVYADIDFETRRVWFVDHISAWRENGGLSRVAFDGSNGAMAGFILIDPATELLDQICVRKSMKGLGVAVQLLAEARRISPQGIKLSVNAKNDRALAFYHREGFVKTGDGFNPHSGLPILHYRWQP